MKNIAQLLVEQNVVQINFENPFTWTSGIKSPIYCDCRELISIPKARDEIVTAFLDKIKDLDCDYIVGPATAGIPWAAFIADRLNIPMLYVRSKPKGHGAGKMVEGKVQHDKPKMVVVEDAFSTGGSSIKSAEALRNEVDAEVTHILGIFSWSTPQSVTNAEAAQVTLAPLTEFHEIVEALMNVGKIDEAQKASLERFHDSPAEWVS
jgi:orotate phosphoribosyltransferase